MNVDAQHYSKGIGLRAGKFNTGITFKNFFATDNATALQLDLYYTNVASGGYTLKGFYIKQIPFNVPIIQLPLDFIFGGGINIGYFPFDPQGYYKREEKDANYYDSSVISVGAGATIQIEYQIKKIAPVTLGIEVVPFYEIINPGPEYVDVGVSIRYVFR
ncbi:MAG: hypothetical protein DWQ44_04060 [Bacteroidetes bacterium]|nr:MAG: hypothetical protein DWQ39_11955 [Bacteroidota bacterium]REK35483.1 MAG: hypothetical protein DWQ44_04060 [Bacteroidota bacterium]REK46833.1 MAG: hypothetical protein DWQ48_13830 [Bacteroidota bacterium]